MGYRHCVEVGVYQGEFAKQLLSSSKFCHLHLVDHWQPYAEQPIRDQADYAQCVQLLKDFKERTTYWKMSSQEAVVQISSPVEFVYIDAAHDYKNVVSDIICWWNKLELGGMLAGHDLDYTPVRHAVLRFFQKRILYIVPDIHDGTQGKHPSWYCVKHSSDPYRSDYL